MTTLAYDGTYVAVDTQLTAAPTKYTGSKHRTITIDGRKAAVFGVGDWSEVLQAIEHLEAAETPPEGDYELLVVSRGEPPRHYQGDGGEPLRLPTALFATGSGAHAALGAMKAGKTAPEAVLIACTIDLYSGAPVETLNVHTGRWLKPRTR